MNDRSTSTSSEAPDDLHHHDEIEEPQLAIDCTLENLPVTPVKEGQHPTKQTKKSGNASHTTNTQVMTVGTVLPQPTKCLIDLDRVSTCSPELLRQVLPCISINPPSHQYRRIDALSNYINVSAKTYALGHIPSNATWGKYDPYDDRSKDLCLPMTNDRFNIWIVGRITTVWFMKSGTPDNQCAVCVMPLSDSLGLQANQLIAGLSSPPLHTFFLI